MRLSGIDLAGTLRLTQPNDVVDEQIELMKTGTATITPDFYTMVFFSLMNGKYSGVDDSGNGIETGIYFKVYDDQGNVIATTPKSKLDWYEGVNSYFVEADVDVNITPSQDFKVAKVELYYTANDVENTAAKDVLIATSTAPGKSSFANEGGIPILAANGQLEIRAKYLLTISK